MKNSKGFTMIEALVAASVLMMVISTLVPLTSLLLNERENLQQKREMANELHNELQPFLRENKRPLPQRLQKTVDGDEAEFRFTAENNLLKGCVSWENVNDRANQFCLYGYPEK
ncbi:type II secretion system protein [Lentibacillus salicampi]|uniref:type II secretion system protein n=1 Tax=Lentibacillus salicampi TaxID=175306 RepID=UPI001431317C|nr:type II secretion system protein [Lentibacillus salicampi]